MSSCARLSHRRNCRCRSLNQQDIPRKEEIMLMKFTRPVAAALIGALAITSLNLTPVQAASAKRHDQVQAANTAAATTDLAPGAIAEAMLPCWERWWVCSVPSRRSPPPIATATATTMAVRITGVATARPMPTPRLTRAGPGAGTVIITDSRDEPYLAPPAPGRRRFSFAAAANINEAAPRIGYSAQP